MVKALYFTAGLSLTVALFPAGQAYAAQEEPTILVLHLDNYARIPPDQLDKSKSEVARIYKVAGIQTVWIEKDGPQGTSPSVPEARSTAVHVRVLLLDEEMAARKIEREAIPSRVLGRSARVTARAYVLTPRVAALATRNRCEFDRLLSRVIAHEVGHLLLPPYSHSPTGIMRETLDMWSPRSESFTRSQRKELQSALQPEK
jgi:hypothetical protein